MDLVKWLGIPTTINYIYEDYQAFKKTMWKEVYTSLHTILRFRDAR